MDWKERQGIIYGLLLVITLHQYSLELSKNTGVGTIRTLCVLMRFELKFSRTKVGSVTEAWFVVYSFTQFPAFNSVVLTAETSIQHVRYSTAWRQSEPAKPTTISARRSWTDRQLAGKWRKLVAIIWSFLIIGNYCQTDYWQRMMVKSGWGGWGAITPL